MNDTAQLTIRAAAATDADRLASLLTDEGYPAGPSDLARRVERFEGEASGVLVAEQADEVLGFVAFHRVPRFEADGWFIRVVTVVVDPGARERGIAKALLSEVERVARDEGAAFLEVTAGHHRPDARQLFESVGYDATVTTYLRKRV
jgi:GNAT superfamily N-acetyltransferase